MYESVARLCSSWNTARTDEQKRKHDIQLLWRMRGVGWQKHIVSLPRILYVTDTSAPLPSRHLLPSVLTCLSLSWICYNILLSSLIHVFPCSAAPCVGLVAGATDIPALKAVRVVAPDMWILCPGVGAQGGDAQVRGRGSGESVKYDMWR